MDNRAPLDQERFLNAQSRHKEERQRLNAIAKHNRHADCKPLRLPGPICQTVTEAVAIAAAKMIIPVAEDVPSAPSPLPSLSQHFYFYVQSYFDKPISRLTLHVLVLSVYIVNDVKFGDLTDKHTITYWLDTVENRQSLLIFGGPPCETWAVAGFNPILGVKNQPWPVRNSQHFWGLLTCIQKEAQSVKLGNDLIRTGLTFVCAAWLYGAPALMEHPAFLHSIPTGKTAPSSSLLQN